MGTPEKGERKNHLCVLFPSSILMEANSLITAPLCDSFQTTKDSPQMKTHMKNARKSIVAKEQ